MIVFGHFIGAENYDYWRLVFETCKDIVGFDIPGRITVVNQEKSIEKAYKDTFEHATVFLDPLHVKMNMSSKLGLGKSRGLALYERAVYAPSKTEVDQITFKYSTAQQTYLSSFKKEELYRAYARTVELVTTSQGAESQMSASLRNRIRCLEPQKMLFEVVQLHRTGFLKRKVGAENCSSPVPPFVDRYLFL